MKRVLSVLLVLFFFQSAFSQSFDEHGNELLVKCHTYEMMDQLRADHPELLENMEESAIEQAAFRDFFSKNNLAKDADIYIIPVVFHVVHFNGQENISPEQIEDAIAVMNRDFAAQAIGINSVNSAFTNLISNTGIKFALAKRDPEGNCTNGIIRTVSETTYQGNDNLKDLSPIWDRSKYLNIWVCNSIASGAAGYSRYPSSVNSSFGATIDGIVVKHSYVGSIGTSGQNSSHTLTHEAGHWLDLPHLWGSTNDPEEEANCNSDDGVSDTPNTIGWTSCNLNGESCGSLDNVQNFMEYSYCSKMYTHGQRARMVAALNSNIAQRNGLWQESNLIATGVLEEASVCAADFAADKTTICVGESIQFQDYSYSGVTERTWIFQGGSPGVSQVEAPEVTYNTPGLYAVSLAASDSFNTVSTIQSNFIRVLDTASVVLPFFEGFENIPAANIDNSDIWYTENTSGNTNWEITNEAAYSGSKSIRLNGLAASNGERANLLSQPFDMTYFDSTNAALTFKFACGKKSASSADKLKVYISKNCGDHWSLRREIEGDDLYTVSGSQGSSPFIPQGQDEWYEEVITSISSVFFTSQFRVKFEFTSQNGNNIYLDNINLIHANTVSVNNIAELKKSVSIYPNPASNIVNVQLDNLSDISNLEMTVHDVSGRKITTVHSGAISGNKKTFGMDISQFPNGLYFIHFKTNNGQFAQKFVVSK